MKKENKFKNAKIIKQVFLTQNQEAPLSYNFSNV
jgi:hypothetical protein